MRLTNQIVFPWQGWFSPRSKQFRGVREQRRTEQRDFCPQNRARVKKRKEGEGEGKFSSPPPPHSFFFFRSSPFFSRAKHRKSNSSVFLLLPNTTKRCYAGHGGFWLTVCTDWATLSENKWECKPNFYPLFKMLMFLEALFWILWHFGTCWGFKVHL